MPPAALYLAVTSDATFWRVVYVAIAVATPPVIALSIYWRRRIEDVERIANENAKHS